MDEDEIAPGIDASLLGMLIRKTRLDLGYRKAEDFVDALRRRAGVEISKPALYRIETGKQQPSIDVLLGINLMLGRPVSDTSLLDMCIPQEWKDKADAAGPYRFVNYSNDKSFDDLPF